MNILKWAWSEFKEKINVMETFREIKALGKKYGRRFFIMALTWELIEDVLFPYLSYKAGVPELIPVFLILHFEPIVYPIAFWVFKTYDRIQGRESWEPERTAMSSHLRSLAKVTGYRVLSVCAFWLLLVDAKLPLWILALYSVVMALFGFVHERIWHDSNYGIDENDQIEPKRIVLKALSYRGVSSLVMGMTLFGFLGHVPWGMLCAYQGTTITAYIVLEGLWAKTAIGIQTIHKECP